MSFIEAKMSRYGGDEIARNFSDRSMLARDMVTSAYDSMSSDFPHSTESELSRWVPRLVSIEADDPMRKFELRLQINCIAQLTLLLELSSSARNFKLISAQQILPAAINAGSYRYYHHHANRHLRKSPHNRRFNSMSQSAERCSRFHHQVRRRKNFFFDCVDEPQIGPRCDSRFHSK